MNPKNIANRAKATSQPHCESERAIAFDFGKTKVPVETLGAFVARVDTEMDALYTSVAQRVQLYVEHSAAPTGTLGGRQHVDMNMGGKSLFEPGGSGTRVGDAVYCVRVLFSGGFKPGDFLAYIRPPVRPQLPVELRGIRGTDNIANWKVVLNKDESEIGSELEIGGGPNEAGQPRVAVKGGCVGATIGGLQADLVERVRVSFARWTYEAVCFLHLGRSLGSDDVSATH